MNGVKINNVHSDTLGLILTDFTIEPPKSKLVKITVPGREGDLDITEELYGKIPLSNRNITLNFKATEKYSEKSWPELQSNVLAYSGANVRVIFDDDYNFYYKGRCTVETYKINGKIISVTMKIDADPYKYRITSNEKSL